MIALIAAMGRNGELGDGKTLPPWRLPDDLKRFRAVTMGKAVLMGRKTFNSLPSRPLPGRDNIVLTRDRSWSFPGCTTVYDDKEAALALLSTEPRWSFVIGGGEVYRLLLPFAREVNLTVVDGDFPDHDDVLFPELPADEWALINEEFFPADAAHSHACTRKCYVRKGQELVPVQP